MKSMTGYASISFEGKALYLQASVKSVNRKNLDIALNLPILFGEYELMLLNYLRRRFKRMQMYWQWEWSVLDKKSVKLEVNQAGFHALQEGLSKIPWLQACDTSKQEWILNFAKEQGWLNLKCSRLQDSEQMGTDLLGALERACTQLDISRTKEGACLQDILLQNSLFLSNCIDQVEQMQEEILQNCRSQLQTRVQELLRDQQLDEGRFEQELALLLEKRDFREELDRLRLHHAHLQEQLYLDEANGRTLDFILVEILRETNTLMAKANHYPLNRLGISMKASIEQMREQVQNVE